MSELERRLHAERLQLRAADGGPARLGGYALKFNVWSRNLGGFVEQVDPHAATKSVTDGIDVLARFQHKDEFLLGRVASGTLRLNVDATGLDYEVDLPDTSTGRDVRELAARGDLQHSSFAFHTVEDSWEKTDSGYPLRTLRAIQLVDVAPVVDPAYMDTPTGLRSLAEQRGLAVEEVEEAARANRLADLLDPRPTVIDLGVGTEGQRATHPGVSIVAARRAFERRRAS